MGIDMKDYYIGDEALNNSDLLNLSYPIEHGFVTNWDDLIREDLAPHLQ